MASPRLGLLPGQTQIGQIRVVRTAQIELALQLVAQQRRIQVRFVETILVSVLRQQILVVELVLPLDVAEVCQLLYKQLVIAFGVVLYRGHLQYGKHGKIKAAYCEQPHHRVQQHIVHDVDRLFVEQVDGLAVGKVRVEQLLLVVVADQYGGGDQLK